MTRTRGIKKTKQNTIVKNKKPPQPSSPPLINSQQGFFSQMASTMGQGFAFGTGSSLAHQTIGSIFNGKQTNTSDIDNDKCQDLIKKYQECVRNNLDTYQCRDMIDDMEKCLKNN